MSVGLSGVLPSSVALAQGAYFSSDNSSGGPIHNSTCHHGSVPLRFSVSTYFGILAFMVFSSMLGFLCLNCLRQKKWSSLLHVSREMDDLLEGDKKQPIRFRSLDSDESSSDDNLLPVTVESDEAQNSFWSKKLAVLLALQTWISCIGNGLTPAVSSYAFVPFGNTAAVAIVNVGMIAGPITAFLALKLAWKDSVGQKVFITLGVLVVIATALSGYIIWLASPMCNRPLQGHAGGVLLAVRDSNFS